MESNICARVGRRIRQLRVKRGWRQIDLAAHAEISRNHIGGIERGDRELCLVNLERIATALETTPSELVK